MTNQRALRTNMLPIPFFLREAKVGSVALSQDGLVFHFVSGFYMPSRDGKEEKSLSDGAMIIHFVEGADANASVFCARKIRWLRRRIFPKFAKDVAAKGMDLTDLFFSRHTKSIIVEGKGKGDLGVQISNVADITFEFSERHVKVYDTPVVNRSDVFQIAK